MRYSSIRCMDISNGENLGQSLFVQGCPPPHCHNCFNPETWDFNGGEEWTSEIEDNFIELAKRPYIKRISLLGGEPLAEQNIDGILNLVNKIRVLLPDKIVWLYTRYDFDLLKEKYIKYKYAPFSNEADKWLTRWEIISQCNILVDGRYIESQRDITLKWRGSSNQRVIDVQKSIKQKKVILHCD